MDPAARLKALSLRANDFPFDNKISLKRFVRSTKEMERMALIYGAEKQTENSFLLYLRLISLIVEKLPKHHEYKTVDIETKSSLTKTCKQALVTAEKLKKNLKEQYQKEYQEHLETERKNKEETANRLKGPDTTELNHISNLNIQQINSNKKATPTAPSAPSLQNISSNLPPAQTLGSYPTTPLISNNDRHHPIAELENNDRTNFYVQPTAPPPPPSYSDLSNQTSPYKSVSSLIEGSSSYHLNGSFHQEGTTNGSSSSLPPPQFNRLSKPNHLVSPDINRDTKPNLFNQRQDSINSVDGCRGMYIPSDLTATFLRLASFNTGQNLETCGILTGKLAHNRLRVTHLVIPKQSATSDSCTTECEEDLFDVQDKYDLITLGWIHTHPSQTSFLSSVDLHTQCSYQQLLPEAIAIVCAPKYNTIGMYRLTPSYGLNYVATCSKTGFHPHPKDPPLFEDSPLVTIENNTTTQVIDLR